MTRPLPDAPAVVLTLPAAVLPPGSSYMRHVIESGHLPGVLSGAELQHDGRNRWASRNRAAEIVAALLQVTPGTVKGCRVWVNQAGERVRLELT